MALESTHSRVPVPHPGATEWTPDALLESFPCWREDVARALSEDAPRGDLTTRVFSPVDNHVMWQLTAREEGVLAGKHVVNQVFSFLADNVRLEWTVDDGAHFDAGHVLACISGPSSVLLTGERVALNYLQRLCGIASRTRLFVDVIRQTKACVLDTRKTTPGLRAFEKYAVCCGGGRTHRTSLSDVVMIKDNHLAALDHDWKRVGLGIQAMRENPNLFGVYEETVHVEIEVDRLDQVGPALEAGADSLLLDGFHEGDLRLAVQRVQGRIPIEASGGVSLETVARIADTGVDFISVGSLTNGYPSIDIGLDADTL